MQIVIPMSGFGERFRRAGYVLPKPLIEIEGKPIIAHVIDLFPGETDFIFICNRDHLAEPAYRMEETIRRYCPTGRVVAIDPHKLGPVHAVLQAANLIDPQQPVVVNYADFTCYWDWSHFRDFVAHNKCDGAIPAYKGFHPHTLGTTNYAYMREADGWVLDIQEKQPYTDNRMEEHASSGTYYFSSGQLMLDAFQATKDRNLTVGGEFYVSLAYKPMLESGKRVAVYELQHFMQWGTPEDVAEYRMWSDTFRRLADPAYAGVPTVGGTTLIPMAGLGQRFLREGYTVTKPLIPVSGKSMVVQATGDLPAAARHVFVLRQDMPGLDDIRSTLQAAFPATHCVILDKPTDGQARTALLGLRAAFSVPENDGPLTIAACDNGALYKPEKLQALLDDPDTDVIVWVARGYPNAARNPQMYGWVACQGNSNLAIGASVKKPLADPKHDPIITGTFTFRRGSDFARSVERMIERDARVNGEFYIDTCIEDALALGLTVRIFEIDSYLCWGTPDDLRTFEYWQSCFDKWPGHPYCLKDDRRVAAQCIDGTASNLSGHGSVPARVKLMQRVDGELPRFVIVGVGSNLLNFLAYLLTHALGAPLVVASGIGYLTGLVNSYYFGRNWVFGAGDRTGRLAILYFIIVYAIGGIGMSTIIEMLDRTQGLDYRVSWFFGAVFAFTNNFLGSKWLVFKGRKIHDGN